MDEHDKTVERMLLKTAHALLAKSVLTLRDAVLKAPASFSATSVYTQLDTTRNRALDALQTALARLANEAQEGHTSNTDDQRVAFLLLTHLNVLSLLQTVRSRVSSVSADKPLDKAVSVPLLKLLGDADTYLRAVASSATSTGPSAPTLQLIPSAELLASLPSDDTNPTYATGGQRTDLVALVNLMKQYWIAAPTPAPAEHLSELQTMQDIVQSLVPTFGTYALNGAAAGGLGTVRTSQAKVERRMSDLIDMITQHNKQMDGQRFVVSAERENRQQLNDVMSTVNKLNHDGRLESQRATSSKLEKLELIEQVDALMEQQLASSTQMDNQRFAPSADKLRSMTVSDLIETVETLTNQRLKNQDAVSPQERRTVMLNSVADIVDQMRRSSLDDQRFVVGMAANMKMSPQELKSSLDSLPSYFSNIFGTVSGVPKSPKASPKSPKNSSIGSS